MSLKVPISVSALRLASGRKERRRLQEIRATGMYGANRANALGERCGKTLFHGAGQEVQHPV